MRLRGLVFRLVLLAAWREQSYGSHSIVQFFSPLRWNETGGALADGRRSCSLRSMRSLRCCSCRGLRDT
jgi:hypothetical protein